jgi:hypothetical protein
MFSIALKIMYNSVIESSELRCDKKEL